MKNPMRERAALVVLSGGQDSTTCLFWALQQFKEVHAITFDYGQRHRAELLAAALVAGMSGIDPYNHHMVTVGPLLKGRSPLTNPTPPLETYANADEMAATIGDRVELTFVPMRNALFLTIAANHAVCADIHDLVTGVCQADNANYPDCRQDFINHQAAAINYALGFDMASSMARADPPWFRIHTPLMDLAKADTVRLAMTLPGCMEAMAYTHTAYSGEYPPITQDHATVLRAKGFADAGVPDPLIVRAWKEGHHHSVKHEIQ